MAPARCAASLRRRRKNRSCARSARATRAGTARTCPSCGTVAYGCARSSSGGADVRSDVDERAARLRRLRELLRAQLSDPAKMRELAARVHASLVVAGVLVDEPQQRRSLRVLRGGAEPSPHESSIALPPHSTEQVNDERSSAPSTIAPSRGPDRPHDGRGAAATLEPQETIGRRAASTCSASVVVCLRLGPSAVLYGRRGGWCCVSARVRRFRA